MSWSAIAPTPVNAEQAIELLSNTRNPNISGYFFLGTYEQPILRCYNNNPNRWLNKFSNHINSGILDCWLRESTIFNALSEYDHMFELASPPGPYHVPKVHLSARLLDQVSHMGKDSLVFFFVVRGLACPQTKLIIRYTLRHTILAMIDEAMQGFSTEFCGAISRIEGGFFICFVILTRPCRLVQPKFELFPRSCAGYQREVSSARRQGDNESKSEIVKEVLGHDFRWYLGIQISCCIVRVVRHLVKDCSLCFLVY